MSAFKQLNRQDVYISDYQAQKNWKATGSLVWSYGLDTLRGFSGSTPGFPYPKDYRNYRYEKLVYNSAHHLYYSLTSGSHTGSYGDMYYTGSYDVSFQTSLMLSHSRNETKEVGIISIPRTVYGTKIVPSTLIVQPIVESDDKFMVDGYSTDILAPNNNYIQQIGEWYDSTIFDWDDYTSASYTEGTGSSTYVTESFSGMQRLEIIDDGQGRLVLSGSEAEYTRSERQVGDVIYNQGNIIITDPTVARYYSTYARLDVRWKSNQPIYTYNVHCTVKESELNHTFNPSALTGSDNTVQNNITGSEFKPYVTSIGLYNEAQELVAVAKTNRPIPKSSNVDMTFVVKLDL